MPSRRDNDVERLARIDALMEEYRIKHEDLEAYVDSVRRRAKEGRMESREGVSRAREALNRGRRKRRSGRRPRQSDR
jgi:hypothetical protein